MNLGIYEGLSVADAENIAMVGKSERERESAVLFLKMLQPCLKRNGKTKRYMTAFGDKTAIGLYRSVRQLLTERLE